MKNLSRFLTLCLLVCLGLGASAFVPVTGGLAANFAEATFADSATVPMLEAFVGQVGNGSASQITGVYVANQFAFPVVQQPASQAGYVSSLAGTLTQFGMATGYGSLGFLAHNTLAGASFSSLKVNDLIVLVYGDGHRRTFQVMQVRRFQAVSPSSTNSSFVDLANNGTLSASDLFHQVYGVKGNLVLQTCISKNGVDNWGRLFVMASEYFSEAGS